MDVDVKPTIRRAFATSVYCYHDGAVLLVKHKRFGAYVPVGGELEVVGGVHETPLEAARREVREETGWEVDFPCLHHCDEPLVGMPGGLLGYEEHNAGAKGTHLCFSFLAFAPNRDPVSDGSWSDPVWLRSARACPDSAGRDTPPNVRQLLARALLLGNRLS